MLMAKLSTWPGIVAFLPIIKSLPSHVEVELGCEEKKGNFIAIYSNIRIFCKRKDFYEIRKSTTIVNVQFIFKRPKNKKTFALCGLFLERLYIPPNKIINCQI